MYLVVRNLWQDCHAGPPSQPQALIVRSSQMSGVPGFWSVSRLEIIKMFQDIFRIFHDKVTLLGTTG